MSPIVQQAIATVYRSNFFQLQHEIGSLRICYSGSRLREVHP
ncbi:hypothetical protein [Nostoc sphaeroides]|uniref:Uncharacterized protein n=1 Tax=Nostoc sphaeroides CCNUC1 TaxID=2653204 RepID=A0A5P8W4W8_9NOSO|nr:hypothetical protein [Nostoc sphaeroides]QFS47551.1 hypothetical protein GXM_05043 [Nostoc sphaeroides CCNUC1]